MHALEYSLTPQARKTGAQPEVQNGGFRIMIICTISEFIGKSILLVELFEICY